MNGFDKLIPVGKKFVSVGRTIGEGDFMMLVNLTWTTDQVHSDKEFMKKTQFGERILTGAIVLACALGLANRSGVSQVLNTEKVRRVAALGFEKVNFTAPVKPGDTITVHSKILDARPTSKDPKRAVVRVKETTFNQLGQQVMNHIRTVLVEMIT